MLRTSHASFLRLSLLTALGAPVFFACGGSAETSGGEGGTTTGSSTGTTTGAISSGGTSTGSTSGGTTTGSSTGSTTGTTTGTTTGSSTGTVTGTSGGSSGCTDAVEKEGGFVDCGEGYTHRPVVKSCSTEVPRDADVAGEGVCPDTTQGCCANDSDCTGENEYCGWSAFGGEGWPTCRMGCLEDADCGADELCECNGGPMGSCVVATCSSDADCAGEARCASVGSDNLCGPGFSYSCQLAEDECAGPADCEPGVSCLLRDGIRICSQEDFCAAGRPFLVADESRTAGLCERGDWDSEVRIEVETLSSDVRDELAASWERAGLMEHASIAAFARFSLQLLSVGAPVELIEETNQAMVDETQHARHCFSLASQYRGHDVGPGALDMTGALGDDSLEAIVQMTIIEGCVGETVAALEAAESAAHCEDEAVASVLRQIAADESRHAELAWKFVRWAIAKHPSLRSVVEAQFEALQASDPNSKSEESPFAAHGVLSPGARSAIRREALKSVVAPCAAELLSRGSGLKSSTHTSELRA